MACSKIVLNLHGIGKPHESVTDVERRYWLPVSRFEQLLDVISREHDPNQILITFDDGHNSDLLAAEILAARGLQGRFFPLVGRLGESGYCDRGDVRRLVNLGMIVGLHGRNHLDWRKLNDADLADETIAARAELADATGRQVDEVAIPFGWYNRRVMRWLQDQQFRRIFTCDKGTSNPQSLIWHRCVIYCDSTDGEIGEILLAKESFKYLTRRAIKHLVYRANM